MEFVISVSSQQLADGTVSGVKTRVTVDGEPIGIFQEVTFRKTAEDMPEVTFRFPPESVMRQREEMAAQYDKYVSLIRHIPWAVVTNGDELSADSDILSYFLGTGTDAAGRTLSQVMAKDDSWYERSHDFVQWMLPTRRRSKYEPGAPVLTDDDVRAFHARRDVRETYSFAVDRIKKFLELDRMRPKWVRAKDHNHKRISRLIESLRDLGFQERAERVLEQVLRVDALNPGVIDREAVEYWRKAPKA